MKNREDILRWGIDKNTQNLVNILHVKNGVACNCACPACKEDLVAYQGNKVIYHFKHKRLDNCTGAAETAIHLKAKEIIDKYKKIKLPSLNATAVVDDISKSITVVRQKIYKLDDDIIIEKREGSIIPDMIVSHNGNKLLIEIAVTHFINSEKLKKIKDINISCIEIDLRELYNSRDNISDEALFKNVIERTDNKKWIYNKRFAEAQRTAQKKAEKEKSLKYTRVKKEKLRRDQFIRQKVDDLLKCNASITVTNSEYHESHSNYVNFQLNGKLHSSMITQNATIYFEPLDFIANFNIDTDYDAIDSLQVEVGETIINSVCFNNLFKREAQRLSNNKLYHWLLNNSTKIGKH